MDVVLICLDFDFKPPRFLFEMAKAFVCLNGADGIYKNRVTGFSLLQEQVDKWLLYYCKDQIKEQAHKCLDEMLSVMNGNPPPVSGFVRKSTQLLRGYNSLDLS